MYILKKIINYNEAKISYPKDRLDGLLSILAGNLCERDVGMELLLVFIFWVDFYWLSKKILLVSYSLDTGKRSKFN